MFRILKKRQIKFIAVANLLALIYQLVFPISAYALTSGPSQPEMQSFEPVGTTDMVNMFTGDFNYNIPLLDVGGYPVNIAYHSGINMEQEASWVGLGWNINPGNINHVVRGLPDDFKGDPIKRELEIKNEESKTFTMLSGVEFSGYNKETQSYNRNDGAKTGNRPFSGQLDFGLTINNYTGVKGTFGKSNSASGSAYGLTAGINMGITVSTADGADFDYGASLGTSVRNAGLNVSVNGKMNSLQGVQYTAFGVNPSVTYNVNKHDNNRSSFNLSNTYIPIGLQNYVPVITNAAAMKSYFFQFKAGAEIYAVYPFWGGSFRINETVFDKDVSKNGYGYFNLSDATEEDLVDFTRDKDGKTHRKSKFLPMTNMTYDIYAINGQGTGGNFRGYRNDIGTVYDPLTGGFKSKDQDHLVEIGFGNTFEIGYDGKFTHSQAKSGPWGGNKRAFSKKEKGKIYEPVYLKQAGELTEENPALQTTIKGNIPLDYSDAHNIINSPNQIIAEKRVARGNLLYFLNAKEASLKQVGVQDQLANYDFDGFGNGNTPQMVARINAMHKEHHASEFTQLLPDGRRYIYGLPVMNDFTKDYEVSVVPEQGNPQTVTLPYDGTKPKKYEGVGTGNLTQSYYSKTETPAYAHSYMLTTILSPDYVDLTGDGISDDDLGAYTKFNYRKRDDYYWRTPYASGTAQYNKGIKSNCNDDKANYSIGKREQWYIQSIESRNFVAEFYTSPRNDGGGASDPTISTSTNDNKVYKLDKIVLYNKQDRFANGTNATPIKTVMFNYNYLLCKGIPNNTVAGKGKLTLRSIYIKYGTSDIGYLSPYTFDYYDGTGTGGANENPTYDLAAKDCWGNYKPSNSNSDPAKNLRLAIGNNDFPYVNQNDPNNDIYSNAWNLKQINLPSGGNIKITYESDDYAYVQDKQAMEMFKVEGAGPTKDFIANNTLYAGHNDPHRYLYFNRKIGKENSTDMLKAYLNGEKLLQYTFDVEISSGNAGSCSNTPLVETVKGYAEVEEIGICSNVNYGYIRIKEKTPEGVNFLSALGKDTRINPISLAAINFCRYYNTTALNPDGEITSTSYPVLIRQLMSQIGSLITSYDNPLKIYLKKEKAKNFNIDKSYIRLVSQGLKKKGGGHRVKRLEFYDTWINGSNAYGSEYDYTIKDPVTHQVVSSSGVASYEPLYGGDENPCRTLLNTEVTGNKSKFPPVDPIELLQEAPLGESLYPPPVVGYSQVTVTSIHKDDGASSQTVQVSEFYTAKDFPVKVEYGEINKVEDRKPKMTDLFNKKDIYRVSQGYTLYLNDMHGKPAKTSLYVDRSGNAPDLTNMERVSYTRYEYFTNPDKTLKNDVPCLEFPENGTTPVQVVKTLGEETDISMDSRQKEEVSNTTSIDFSANTFLVSVIPICLPSVFPSFKKETNTFSSLVTTKVVQRYGIIKAVEDYKKGALVRAENTAFDPKTGQVLVTAVNTERNDNEYNIKYPAYWAYRCMGPAYENIHFEENFSNSFISNNKLYVNTSNLDKYNMGDEVLLSGAKFCSAPALGSMPIIWPYFKLWVVDKIVPPLIPSDDGCSQSCPVSTTTPLLYRDDNAPQPSLCYTLDDVKNEIVDFLQDSRILNIQEPIEEVSFNIPETQISFNTGVKDGSFPCGISDLHFLQVQRKVKTYKAKMHLSYTPVARPYSTPNIKVVKIKVKLHHFASTNVNLCNNLSYKEGEQVEPIGEITIKYPVNTSVNTPFFPNSSPYLSPLGSCDFMKNKKGITDCPERKIWHLSRKDVYYEEKIESRQQNIRKYLVLSPLKKGAMSINAPFSWPANDKIPYGALKVIRSGKRNQLGETVQEITTLTSPLATLQLPNYFSKTINAVGKTFTQMASVPAELLDVNTDYINPYVTGQKGNYRVLAEYLVHKDREYNNVTNNADIEKGLYGVTSFWNFFNNSNEEFYHRMLPVAIPDNWNIKSSVTQYSPWSVDLEVEDAVKNRHANIMGYDNRTVIGTVSNSEYNDALYENFEDYGQVPTSAAAPPVYFYQNALRKDIRNQLDPSLIGTNMQIIKTAAHTGTRALQFNTPANLSVPIGPGTQQLQGALKPFWFRLGTKYLITYWQKVTTPQAPPSGSLRLNGGGIICTPVARTPVIDGWVLYEGQFILPGGASGQMNFASLAGNLVIDDLRVMPSKSNMKCYVYHPANKRLMAILDENHMATFMEYSDEGKLVRVKKETEKGVLTIKESRESLNNRFMQNGVIVQPPLPNE